MSDTPGISKAGLPVLGLLPGPLVDLAKDAAGVQADTTHLSLAEAEAMLADPKYRPLLAALRKQGAEEIRDGQTLLRALARFYGQAPTQRRFLQHAEQAAKTLANALRMPTPHGSQRRVQRTWQQLREHITILAAYRPQAAAIIMTELLLDPKLRPYSSYLLELLRSCALPLDETQAIRLISMGRIDVREAVALAIGEERTVKIFSEIFSAPSPNHLLVESALTLCLHYNFEAVIPLVLAAVAQSEPMGRHHALDEHLRAHDDGGMAWLIQHGVSHQDPAVRIATLEQIRERSLFHDKVPIAWALPALTPLLNDAEVKVREAAAIHLGFILAESIPKLVEI